MVGVKGVHFVVWSRFWIGMWSTSQWPVICLM